MINRNKLRGLMAENKLTQTKLAEMIGITTNAFNTKINGKSVFNETEIKRLAEIFNVTTDCLFTI